MKSAILGLITLFIVLYITGCKEDSNPVVAKALPSDTATIKIGTQTWMRRNLNVSTYRNGDIIPQVTDTAEWSKLTTGAWCYYNNDPENGKTYGKLYNWYAVTDPRGLAPAGWHVPSDDEWKTLEMSIGMTKEEVDATGLRRTDKGGRLKETGTDRWITPNIGATDSVGFTALPGGLRTGYGISLNIGYYGYWWTTNEYSATEAWYRDLFHMYTYIYNGTSFKTIGLSVRCVKD